MSNKKELRAAKRLANKPSNTMHDEQPEFIAAPAAPAAHVVAPSNTPALTASANGTTAVAVAAAPRIGKGRANALRMLAMLAHGPVTKAQCAEIDPNYPCDVPYYARLLYKADIVTTRGKGMPTTYTLRTPLVAPVAQPEDNSTPATE